MAGAAAMAGIAGEKPADIGPVSQPGYSWRRASIGSMRAARRAGK